MPKSDVGLSEAELRTAKPADKEYKLAGGGGLYLLVTKTGGKLWRFDYRYSGKRKTASFAVYPQISLVDARGLRDDARKMLANDGPYGGWNPSGGNCVGSYGSSGSAQAPAQRA